MVLFKTFECEEHWDDFRKGFFTASEISKLMTEPKKKDEVLSEGAKTYIESRVCNLYSPQELKYYNPIIEHGKETEAIASMVIEKEIGDDSYKYCSPSYLFLYDTEINLGGSPDAIMRNSIIEIKCPLSKTHLKYMTLKTVEQFKKVCPEYYAQMQCNMFLTDKSVGIFASYDDRFYNPKHHLHLLEVPRDDEFIERMLEKVQHANNYRNFLINLINNTNENN